MNAMPLSTVVERRLRDAARRLGAADPVTPIQPLIERSFALPAGDPRYANNALTPGAAPFEPSFSESEPNVLRFTIQPLGPQGTPPARRDESTREMRRLIKTFFGKPALHWFDERSEEWRGWNGLNSLHFGAWLGTASDHEGFNSAKVYYEMLPGQDEALPPSLRSLVQTALALMPNLIPIFTSIRCGREHGNQRVTFYHRGPLRLADLGPVLNQLGMGHQLPSIMQVVGLALGGRFDLPERSVLLGLREGSDGPELKLEVLLDVLPDVPPSFLDLLALGMAERPRELQSLQRWLRAFTPEMRKTPGEFSVLSIRATPQMPARVSLYLRPIEFEMRGQLRAPEDSGDSRDEAQQATVAV